MKIIRYFGFLFLIIMLFSGNVLAIQHFHTSSIVSRVFRWPIGGIAFLLIISLIIYSIVKSSKEEKPNKQVKEETPQEIIIRRYAKGEIDQKEFNNLVKIVKESQNEL